MAAICVSGGSHWQLLEGLLPPFPKERLGAHNGQPFCRWRLERPVSSFQTYTEGWGCGGKPSLSLWSGSAVSVYFTVCLQHLEPALTSSCGDTSPQDWALWNGKVCLIVIAKHLSATEAGCCMKLQLAPISCEGCVPELVHNAKIVHTLNCLENSSYLENVYCLFKNNKTQVRTETEQQLHFLISGFLPPPPAYI